MEDAESQPQLPEQPPAPAPESSDVPANPVTPSAPSSATIDINQVNATAQMAKKRAKLQAATKAAKQQQLKPRAPTFKSLTARAVTKQRREMRNIPVPPHRMTPLRNMWMEVYQPIVTQLKLQVRMNLGTKAIQLKTSPSTTDPSALQKGEDFVRAIVLGFSVADALALVRLDELFVETFDVKDIRGTLKGDHLARAVGRIAGKEGRTKFSIENATKTRIVVADTRIHLLGSFDNIRLARNAISSLVLGSAPGKVYNKLRTVSARLNERKF